MLLSFFQTRNALEYHDERALTHHRKLANEKYSTSGFGVNTEAYWQDSGTCEYSSSFYLYASNSVYKFQANGKPTKTPSSYAWGYLELWSNCEETSATHTYAYIDVYGGTESSLSVSKKLSSASFDLNLDVFAVTETCEKICYTEEYEEEEYEWCYYGNCVTVSDGLVPATLHADFTATDVVSTFSSTSKYSGPGYTNRYKAKGKERPATVELSFDLAGVAVNIPVEALYGTIQQTTSGEIYKY